MIRLVDPSKPIKWVHPDEKDEKGKPLPNAMIWGLLPLTEKQSRAMYADIDMGALARGAIPKGEVDNAMLEMFADHVKFIHNVVLPGQGTPRDLTTRADLDRFLDCVPPGVMDKVYVAIQNLSALDDGAVGN